MWEYSAAPAYVDDGLWGIYVYDTGLDSTSYAVDTLSGKSVNSSNIMSLTDSAIPVLFFDGINPQIEALDNGGIVTLSDRSYRGRIEFGRYSGSRITAVNVVGLEEYLYGVVPSEMPSSWESEAIKAQAVAARSYALTRRDMNVHLQNGYELCDGVNCQVYIGYTNESQQARDAVDSTRGEIAYYNDMPINAVFFSSSGGSTDDSENVWSDAVPYLRAVPEITEDSPAWTRTFTQRELSDMVAAKGKNIGNIESIAVSTGKYGRIQELKLNGDAGSCTLSKEETRTFCSGSAQGSLLSRMYTINTEKPYEKGETDIDTETKYDTSGNGTIFAVSAAGIIESELKGAYTVDSSQNVSMAKGELYTVSSNGTEKLSTESKSVKPKSTVPSEIYSGGTVYPIDGKFVFYGRGNGHGVGMSQYGAQGMAKAGYSYREILEHYYTDITVK